MTSRRAATAAAIAILAVTGASASAETFRSEYAVSLLGLTIARSTFDSEITGDRFRVKGTITSAGLGAVFDDTKGTTVTEGRFQRGVARPASYTVDYVSNRKKKRTEIAFSGGSVVKAENLPVVDTNRPTWIKVAGDHLKSVADPLSATLIHAKSAGEVCGRTVRIFDGALRADLVLSYKRTKPVSIPGFKGEAVECSARFVPISGYRTDNKSIRTMKDNKSIRVAFAPVGATGIFVPIEASVGTPVGTVSVVAKRFETLR